MDLGLNIVPVFYKGAGPGTLALLSNEADIMFANPGVFMALIKTGRLRPIAVASVKRIAVMPDLPTFGESGFPGYDVQSWYGVCAPAATPAAVLDKLHADVNTVLRMPDVRQRLDELVMGGAPTSREEFDKFIRAEIARWAQVIKDAGIPQQ